MKLELANLPFDFRHVTVDRIFGEEFYSLHPLRN